MHIARAHFIAAGIFRTNDAVGILDHGIARQRRIDDVKLSISAIMGLLLIAGAGAIPMQLPGGVIGESVTIRGAREYEISRTCRSIEQIKYQTTVQ